jgi:hypothetical protein
MITYRGQEVDSRTCPKQLGPKEHENIFQYTQNEYYADLEFIDCELPGGLTTYGAAIHRSSAANIHVTNCRSAAFFGTGAIFDEVVVDGIRTSRAPVNISACVFRHVTVKGTCNGFLFNRNICDDNAERNASFIVANKEYYRNVDWALDISQLKCSRFELRGCVPVELIRRNPDEHFIMTKEVALSHEWKKYEPMNWFYLAINDFLESQAERNLFVAPRRSKTFKEELRYYLRLKDAELVS